MTPTPLQQLLSAADLPLSLADHVEITRDADPVLATRYKITATGAAAIAASALAAARLWALKTGRQQTLSVDGRAATAAMRSNHYLKIDGAQPPRPRDKVTGFYRTGDGRWVYLHCNFPNLRDRNFALLGVPAEREAGIAAVARWKAEELEAAIAAAGGCAAMIRSEEEWNALPQAAAVAKAPLIEIVRIGDAPPEPLPPGERPLSGIRVLDLTRVLAGPTCARTLAEHGADVMKVARPDLPDSGMFDLDTGLGKLSTFIDFRKPDDDAALRAMIREADVFSQSYRPGALAAHGLSPEDIATLRPGIVYVTLNAWGPTGPWAEWRGYDTIVQGPNGMAYRPDNAEPAFLPVSAQDYVAGYLLAYGTMLALERRAREGGSWMVRMSLARTGHWIRAQGLVDPVQYEACGKDLPGDEVAGYMMESDSPVGRLSHLAPVAKMSETPARWARPAVPLGTHPPRWPSR
jgi:crotonobetainyl-CoA:carnitine CoA-transferase CaiB-like acyl-CoA transferase